MSSFRLSHITNKLALEYATRRQDERPASWSRRFRIIRGFARYRFGADPRTEIPPIGLLKIRSERARPYLYSEDAIHRLLEAALNMKTRYQLQRHTYYCLLGLLAVTGLRLGEAIHLQPQDVDLSAGILTVRGAKFGKSRLVPLHPSTRAVLRDYGKHRDQLLSGRWFMGGRMSHDQQMSMLRRSLAVLREVKEKTGNIVWMSAERISWDLTSVIDDQHPLDWIVVGAASDGRRYFQPSPSHVRNLLFVMDATSTPVFYKGNIRATFEAHDFGSSALNRWREDFPLTYRNGEAIPAVMRRQSKCEVHGWTKAVGLAANHPASRVHLQPSATARRL